MSIFISYSWDDEPHKQWVKSLATRLRSDGVDVLLDHWGTVPGDQLPAFMERAIRENEFVVIICTPRYKMRSDNREGGVGYEGDIMTAEVINKQNHRKFIPVLRHGIWADAAPTWLAGKYRINLSGDPFSEREYEDMVRTLLKIWEDAPPLGERLSTIKKNQTMSVPKKKRPTDQFEDIRIARVVVENVTEPRADGTRGSALYSIPFALSSRPPYEWAELFIRNWDRPPQFTTMHRPGIASLSGSTITLNGTTIEEVEQYHRDTLQLAVDQANRQYREWKHNQDYLRAREEAAREEHHRRVDEGAKRINFD